MKKSDIKKINPLKFSKGKQVKCAIFQTKNETIEKITQAINETTDIKEKEPIAQKLLKEVEKLLTCEYFSRKKIECKTCRYISQLRKQTANLILKAKQLKKI